MSAITLSNPSAVASTAAAFNTAQAAYASALTAEAAARTAYIAGVTGFAVVPELMSLQSSRLGLAKEASSAALSVLNAAEKAFFASFASDGHIP